MPISAESHIETPSLKVSTQGGTRNFPVAASTRNRIPSCLSTAGHPRLNVDLAVRRRPELLGGHVEHTKGKAKLVHKRHLDVNEAAQECIARCVTRNGVHGRGNGHFLAAQRAHKSSLTHFGQVAIRLVNICRTPRLMRSRIGKHLNLGKLVEPVQSPRGGAAAAGLVAKAVREGGVKEWERNILARREQLACVKASERDLAGAN